MSSGLICIQLTVDTYGAAVLMLSQVIERSENSIIEQNSEVLGAAANYFMNVATFVSNSYVTINITVSHNFKRSLQSNVHDLCRLSVTWSRW